jgi:NADH:ubiquinone oxidoreductase subunit 6 (subunit J)
MTNQRSNGSLWLGALFLVLAFVLGSLPFFAQVPGQKALPWLNLLLGAVAVAFFIRGLLLAKRKPALYRGKAAGWILTVLSSLLFLFSLFAYYASRHIPDANAAPQVGQKAPDFELKDTSGQSVSLAQLLASSANPGKTSSQPKAVLLVFYRGYW